MIYSGDEECGDEITSGIFPDDHYELPDGGDYENDSEMFGETR